MRADTQADAGYLHWRTREAHVFFQWWVARTAPQFWASTLALFVLAAGFEVLAVFRQHIDRSVSRAGASPSGAQNVLRSALHGASYFLGQVLMMAFMAANGYFCAALVLGRALGFLACAVLWPPEKSGEVPVYGPHASASAIASHDAYRPCCG